MIASSGLGFKLWNIESLDLVKDYPIIGRSKQSSQINSFHIKHDSN
jgi:hypothetical protein